MKNTIENENIMVAEEVEETTDACEETNATECKTETKENFWKKTGKVCKKYALPALGTLLTVGLGVVACLAIVGKGSDDEVSIAETTTNDDIVNDVEKKPNNEN